MVEMAYSDDDQDKQIGVAAGFDLIAVLPLGIQQPYGGPAPVTGFVAAGLFSCETPASL